MKRFLLVVAAGLLVAAGDAKKDDGVNEDLKKLEGTWTVESATHNGQDDRARNPGEVTFSGDTVTASEGSKERKAKITIDPTKNPKALDFRPEGTKPNEAPGRAIYELKGDSLRLCIGPPDKARPTEFSDKDQILLTLKRKKS